MIPVATTSVHRLARGDVDGQPVMAWTCPVPYFGRLRHATVATLGINPSNREFVDVTGQELDGADRRFPTLGSLGLRKWEDASSLDLTAIVSACDRYFSSNPYHRWFDTLDVLVHRAGASYYSVDNPAAHLDLVPYATHVKWGALRVDQQRSLLCCAQDLLAALLRDSSVELLLLNGASVVRQFEAVAEVDLTRTHQPSWDLSRRQGSERVRGIAYTGTVDHIGEIDLGRSIAVAGFNHNLQSSFGITKRALHAIAHWVATQRP
jgi:hypothetical protein